MSDVSCRLDADGAALQRHRASWRGVVPCMIPTRPHRSRQQNRFLVQTSSHPVRVRTAVYVSHFSHLAVAAARSRSCIASERAASSAVRPSLLTACTSAPRARSSLAQASSPFQAALASGARPSWLRALTSPPRSQSNTTTSAWPNEHARCSGVLPTWGAVNARNSDKQRSMARLYVVSSSPLCDAPTTRLRVGRARVRPGVKRLARAVYVSGACRHVKQKGRLPAGQRRFHDASAQSDRCEID